MSIDYHNKSALRTTLIVLVGAIVLFAILYYFVDPNAYTNVEMMQDGSIVYKETIDGHLYYRTDKTLTHSEACPNPSHAQNQ